MAARGRLVLATLGLAALPLLAQAAEGAQQEGWGPVVARVANFAILVGGLVYLLRKPISGYLMARADQIRQELAEAEEKKRRAAEEREKVEARLASLDREVAEIREKARREAESERERILAAAAEEAERIQAAARREIGAELEVARRQLTSRATELAVQLAQKKLAQNVNERDREVLFEKSLERLERVR
jgi:F-type H+-transporting ATPase subunit b